MKRKVLFSLLAFVVLVVPFGRAPVVLAQGQSNLLYMPAVIQQPAVSEMAIEAQIGQGMIDTWVFIDADQNGIYSAGDTGLSDAVVCINLRSRFQSCVGTDLGDTWWEDLRSGIYQARVDRSTLPPGLQLRSIRCEETGSRVEYRGCDYRVADWSSRVKLGKTTRLNIFFALEE